MQITLFGIIWIIICFYYLLRRSLLSCASLFLFSFVLQSSAVFIFSGNPVEPPVFAGLILIIKSFFVNGFVIVKTKNKAVKAFVLYAVGVLMISIFASIWFRGITYVEGDNDLIQHVFDGGLGFYRYFVLFLYVWCATVIVSLKWNYELVSKVVMLSVYFVLTVGIIQVLIGFNIIPKTVLIGELLYSNTLSSYHSIYPVVTRRLYSTFIEPSYCSAFLIGAFWFIALNDFKKKKKFALLLLTVIEIVFTLSTTAFFALLFTLLVYLIARKRKTIPKQLFLILILGTSILVFVLLFTDYFDSIINKILKSFSKPITQDWYGTTIYVGSESIRTQWNINAWKVFLDTQGWGIGYSVLRGSSLVFSILAQIGILGTVLYINFLKMVINEVDHSPVKDTCKDSIAMMIWAVIGCQIASCPDLNFMPLWMSIFLGLCISTISKQRNENENV